MSRATVANREAAAIRSQDTAYDLTGYTVEVQLVEDGLHGRYDVAWDA